MIPFLRDSKDSPSRVHAENQGKPYEGAVRVHKFMKKRELSWNNLEQPIASFNEKVHSSRRISLGGHFEKVKI